MPVTVIRGGVSSQWTERRTIRDLKSGIASEKEAVLDERKQFLSLSATDAEANNSAS